jgi:hypothetical protein
VATHSDRLTGFCSVNPLKPYAKRKSTVARTTQISVPA